MMGGTREMWHTHSSTDDLLLKSTSSISILSILLLSFEMPQLGAARLAPPTTWTLNYISSSPFNNNNISNNNHKWGFLKCGERLDWHLPGPPYRIIIYGSMKSSLWILVGSILWLIQYVAQLCNKWGNFFFLFFFFLFFFFFFFFSFLSQQWRIIKGSQDAPHTFFVNMQSASLSEPIEAT